jgi:hypothetical protein
MQINTELKSLKKARSTNYWFQTQLGSSMGFAALCLALAPTLAEPVHAETRVVVSTNLQRIPPLSKDVTEAMLSPSAELNLARNEYEALQVVVLADEQPTRDVSITVSDLKQVSTEQKGRKSATNQIRADNVSVRRVEYISGSYKRPIPEWDAVFYEDPSATAGRLSTWPDPLQEISKPFDIEAGASQPLWVQVYVPPKTRPGTYTGNIRVQANGQILKNIPLKVQVWDFELPQKTHLRSTFHIWDGALLKYHNCTDIREPRFQTIRRKYVDLYLKNRVSPFTPANYPVDMKFTRDSKGEINIDFTEFDKQMQHAFNNGLNAFQWPGHIMLYPERQSQYTGGPYIWDANQKKFVWIEMNENWGKPDASQRKQLEALSRKIALHLQKKGWLNHSVAYMVGEPMKGHDQHVPGLEDFEYARQIFGWLHGINPGIHPMTAMLHDSYSPEIAADVDVWATDTSTSFKFLDREKAEMQKGRQIWTYLPGFYRIDNLAAAYRIGPWFCFKYGLQGFGPFTDSTAWQVTDANPWTPEAHTAASIPDDWIVYPGKDGPVDTIRFTLLRDGMEDYEYLRLLQQSVTRLRKTQPQSPLLAQADRLLTADSIIRERDPFEKGDWDYSPQGILAARKQIGDLYQQITYALK